MHEHHQDQRILHTVFGVGPASFGLGSVALSLASAQNAAGSKVCIWCLDDQRDIDWATATSGLERGCIQGFASRGPRGFCYSPGMMRAARDGSRAMPTVVHQHGIWTGISRIAHIMRSRHGVPSVIAAHGSLEQWALNKSFWKKRIALALYERENLHNAACLHAVSQQEVAGFRNFGLRQPIAVIPNGISTQWLSSQGNGTAFRHRFSIPPNRRIMLFLSRISPVKGLPMLLEALHRVRGKLGRWLLVIAGADEFDHKAYIVEIIRRLRLEDHVVFTGLLVGQEKRDAFAAADFFVLPTRREAAPVVVLEALGASLPVLTTRGAPWEELLHHNCGWWVDVDPAALAEALHDALDRPSGELRRMGQRGKELVASRYSWAHSARMTLYLYGWLNGRCEKPEFVHPG